MEQNKENNELKNSNMETDNKIKEVKAIKIVPLFLLTSLIVVMIVLIIVLIIGIRTIDNSKIEISEISKNAILGATQDIGTNVTATINSETGEVTISSISEIGTINKDTIRSLFYQWEDGDHISIKTITFANQVYAPEDSSYLFNGIIEGSVSYELRYLTTINNLNNLNTSNVTNVQGMFSNCRSLTSVDVNNWNTENVTNMRKMFEGCTSLTTLDLSNFKTSSVTIMDYMFNGCSQLQTIDVNNWNTENVTDMSFMFYNCTSLTSLDLSNFNNSQVTAMCRMFEGCSNLTSIDLTDFGTTNVTTMNRMFRGCKNLSTLDLSSFNTSKVTDMNSTFQDCMKLMTLDLNRFDTSSVTDMSFMFSNCTSLTTLDLSTWDMNTVTNTMYFIDNCTSLTHIYTPKAYSTQTVSLPSSEWYNLDEDDNSYGEEYHKVGTNVSATFNETTGEMKILSRFNLSNTYNSFTAGTFEGSVHLSIQKDEHEAVGTITRGLLKSFYNTCGYNNIKTITFENQVKAPEDSSNLFENMYNVTAINNLNYLDTSDVTSMRVMFRGCSSLTALDLSNFDTSKVTDMSDMFSNCSVLTTLELSNFKTSNVTAMSSMFSGCSGLTTLNLSGFDTSKVRNITQIFADCSSLTTIDVSNFETSNATSMNSMFRGCSNLTTLNLSNFDTSNVNNMTEMFRGCNSLTTLDLSSFDTSDVKSMEMMFAYCSSLMTLDLSSFKTSNVKEMNDMFYECTNLETIDVSEFNTSNTERMVRMFSKCEKLTTLNMSNWDMGKVEYTLNMLSDCSSLTDIYTPETYSSKTITLPSNYYNVTDTSDNNSYTSFINGTFTGSVHLKKLVDYNITYDLGDDSVTENPTTYNALSSFTLNNPTKTGYTFTGWTCSNEETPQMTVSITPRTLTGDLTYTANWTIDSYKQIVQVRYENADGTYGAYNDVINENYNYGEEVSWNLEATDEYEAASIETYTVTEAKTTEITVNRKTYTVTLNKDTGIKYVSIVGSDEPLVGAGPVSAQYRVGETVTINATLLDNTPEYTYTWNHWTVGTGDLSLPGNETTVTDQEYTFEMPAEDITYTAIGVVDIGSSYTVKHWQENLSDETYTLIDTENLIGTKGETVTPEVKKYQGFISPETESLTISADGSSELNYYYARRKNLSYTVKYLEKGTDEEIKPEKTVGDKAFESEITASSEVIDNIYGYNYDSVSTDILKISTGENVLNIYYTKKDSKVIVHHYIYDMETGEYTETKLIPDIEIEGKVGDIYTTSKSSKITANYSCINEEPENYTGKMEEETIETSYYYELITPTVEGNLNSVVKTEVEKDEDGQYKISKDQKIEYVIEYETEVEDYIGRVTIEITAKLPAEIDLEKSDLKGGTYDPKTNTIKWTEERNIDTFKNGNYKEKIEKEIAIVYQEETLENIEIDVSGKTITYYPEGYLEKGGEIFVEKGKISSSRVIVHHYAYDIETGKETESKLTNDEEIKGIVGQEYTTKRSSKISKNYELVNETPKGYTGKMGEEAIEVSYYYKLITAKIEDNISSKVKTEVKKDENGKYIITKDQEIKYLIAYETKVEDYIGRVTIEITAKLPAEIDLEKSDLKGGIYDPETNTIKWTEERNVDTFKNGAYTEKVEKEITIRYKEDAELDNIGIKVEGKTIIYYPERYIDKGEQISTNVIYAKRKTGYVIVKYLDIDTNEEITFVGAGLDSARNLRI